MACEDFTDYVEKDPNNRITVTSNKVNWAGIDRNESAWIVKNKGENHFDGDFEHLLEIYLDSESVLNATTAWWALSNTIDDFWGIQNSGISSLIVFSYVLGGGEYRYFIREGNGVINYDDFCVLSPDTLYYLKVKRDESIGDFGTFYCYIYLDSDRTNLLATLTLVLHTSKKDFQYIYGFDSYNTGHSGMTHTGYTQNLDLQGAPPPTAKDFAMFMNI